MAISTHPLRTSTDLPRNRSKDIAYFLYFQGQISRAAWKFIMYRCTEVTGWFALVTLGFLAYGSNSLDIQTYVPACYLLAIWIVSLGFSLFLPPRARLEAAHRGRARAGEIVPVRVTVTQFGRTPQALTVVPHRLPPELDPEIFDGVRSGVLKRGERAELTVGLLCRRRGAYTWSGFRVETDFPFALFRSYRTLLSREELIVTPAFSPIERLAVPAGTRFQVGGLAMALQIGESYEYIGNREYRAGDSLRHIDWRATARHIHPIVREYREEYYLRVAVLLDTCLPRRQRDEESRNFERAVSVAAAVTDFLSRSDYIVELFVAGQEMYPLTASSGVAFIDQIMTALATVEADTAHHFGAISSTVMPSLATATSVICVLIDWDADRQEFLTNLSAMGVGVKVLVVSGEPPPVMAPAFSLYDVTFIDRQRFDNGIGEL